jgi:tetratricopeptide (TPR) repeat protein
MGLLGEGHSALVHDILSRLDRLVAGDVSLPRVIVLEGGSGTGKSRVVREVYRSLQGCQPSPGYWPALLESDRPVADAGSDPMPARKRLGPSTAGFVWPADALPSFAWWVFDCDRMPKGDLLDVIAQAGPALRAHLPAVRLAWRDAAGWQARMSGGREQVIARAREALAEGGVEAVDQLLAATNVWIPGLGLGLKWLRQAGSIHAVHRGEIAVLKREFPLGGEMAEERNSAAVELAELLGRIAHPRVPAIVVVEDLHLLGAELDEFLTIVAQRDADHPVLVIGTAWPEGKHNKDYDRWVRKTKLAGNLEYRAMPDLDRTDLITLLRRYAPGTSDEAAARVLVRYSNPLALQLYLTLDDIQDQITDGGGALTANPDELAQLPDTIRGLYNLRWSELPSHIRTTLSYVAATLPSDQPSWPYFPVIVLNAIQTAGVPMPEVGIGAALSDSVTPYAWIDIDQAGLHHFREALLGEIARHHLSRKSRNLLEGRTTEVLRSHFDELRGSGSWVEATEENLHCARWLVALTCDEADCPGADAAALILVARADADAHRPAIAVQRLGSRDWQFAVLPDHPNTLTTRRLFAHWLGEAGRAEEAVTQLQRLLTDHTKVLGPDHLDTQSTVAVLTYWLAEAGRFEEAGPLLVQLFTDQIRVLGPDHPDTLLTRNNLAHLLGEAGQPDEAAVWFRQLLMDQIRVLGPDHLYTLLTRNNLAQSLAEAGRVEEAVTQLKQLLTDETQLLGPDHRHTLTTRGSLASALGQAGRVEEAMTEFRELLADRLRVLGPEHPVTLSTQANLAYWLGLTGRVEEAVTELQQVLTDQTRVIGPDQPNTLSTRNNVAGFLAQTGRVEEAVAEFRQLLADQTRVLGPDHPDTLATRHNLAAWLGEAGRSEEAVTQFRELLTDQTRVLGSDHPNALSTRNNLAGFLGDTGRADEAVTEFRQLLTDQTRVLGPDHPDTLSTRNNLGAYVGYAGRVEEAVTQFRELLTDRTRVLGPDHPDTLTTRHNFAYWLGVVGDVEEA